VGLSGPLQGRGVDGAARLRLRPRRHQRVRHLLKKHYLDRIDTLDILDCNGGDHGQPFATNFNPEINIREVTAPARHWENGAWVETPALSHKQSFDFEAVGPKNMYLMYHEELESLAKHLPEIKRIRFWMTFGDAYIKHLEVLQNVGMTRIDPVIYNGQEIIPLQFLKAVLPEPSTLGATTKGKTNIGDIATGIAKDGSPKTSTSTTSATMRMPMPKPAIRR
jgi:saccharopine dehydrogenase (NAD+, L-lysine-forming)